MAVVIATCLDWPDLLKSEQLFADALSALGIEVAAGPWNGDQGVFKGADLVLLRACWDYHRAPGDFLAWLDGLEMAGVPVQNHLKTVRWNIDKSYILDLEAAGVAVPRSRVVTLDSREAIGRAMDGLDLDLAVLKPISGQSGFNVMKVKRQHLDTVDLSVFSTDRGLLQSFESDISERGETALVFFNGRFSHAARRVVAPGEWRANSQFGITIEAAKPPAEVIAAAARALTLAPEAPLYARVDGIVRDRSFLLMEMELIEPALYLDSNPAAPARFAAAVEQHLERMRA